MTLKLNVDARHANVFGLYFAVLGLTIWALCFFDVPFFPAVIITIFTMLVYVFTTATHHWERPPVDKMVLVRNIKGVPRIIREKASIMGLTEEVEQIISVNDMTKPWSVKIERPTGNVRVKGTYRITVTQNAKYAIRFTRTDDKDRDLSIQGYIESAGNGAVKILDDKRLERNESVLQPIDFKNLLPEITKLMRDIVEGTDVETGNGGITPAIEKVQEAFGVEFDLTATDIELDKTDAGIQERVAQSARAQKAYKDAIDSGVPEKEAQEIMSYVLYGDKTQVVRVEGKKGAMPIVSTGNQGGSS